MKISKRILILFCFITLLLAALCFNVILTMQNRYNARALEQQYEEVELFVSTIRQQLYNLDDQIFTLSVSSQINLFSMYKFPSDWPQIYEKSRSLHEQLRILCSSYSYAQKAIMAFPPLNRQITNSVQYEALENDALIEKILSTPNNIYIEDDTLYISHELMTNHIKQGQGLICILISTEKLLMHFGSGLLPIVSTEFILSPKMDGTAVSVNQLQWQTEKDKHICMAQILSNEGDSVLWLKIIISEKQQFENNRVFIVFYTFIALLFVTALFAMAKMLKHTVTKPLQKLTEGFDQIAQGNMQTRITDKTSGEFVEIYSHFNQNADKLNQLIENEYQTRISKQQVEIKYLQSQIQPHFLYNAFYQLYRICRMDGSESGAELALQLSGYYEYIAHGNQEGTANLANEILHAKRYIAIQQQRYGERLQVDYRITDAAMDVSVPKLLLQPLIENSIKHCLEKYSCPKLMIIMGIQNLNGTIMIDVEDNGDTLSDEDIAYLSKRLEQYNEEDTNSGMMNIHRRLVLSGNSGLRLSRSNLGGLHVEIVLPA